MRSKRINLRKVLGTENPADVFTKHLASRDKLMEVMNVFDLDYRDGRAESSPDLRREQRPRVEMKEIDDPEGPEDEAHVGDEVHLLPHLQDSVDDKYPIVQAADDWESFDESLMHGFDYLKVQAEKLAAEVQEEVLKHGRRRNVAAKA